LARPAAAVGGGGLAGARGWSALAGSLAAARAGRARPHATSSLHAQRTAAHAAPAARMLSEAAELRASVPHNGVHRLHAAA
jgi:hypothetical protein